MVCVGGKYDDSCGGLQRSPFRNGANLKGGALQPLFSPVQVGMGIRYVAQSCDQKVTGPVWGEAFRIRDGLAGEFVVGGTYGHI